jgi:putative ABC transport system ATP-binding protein
MLDVQQATKTYRRGGQEVQAAHQVSLQADEGDLVVIRGPSGSGKTTLLLMIGGMLRPDRGIVLVGGHDIYRGGRAKRNRYRRQTVGFVFQRFYLIPYLSVYDNIRLPLGLAGRRRDAKEAVEDVARRLGLDDRLRHTPDQLSAGEQQRAALARALAAGQRLILADEPTGNLDEENARTIAACLVEESRRGRTIIVATHDQALLNIGTKQCRMERGALFG